MDYCTTNLIIKYPSFEMLGKILCELVEAGKYPKRRSDRDDSERIATNGLESQSPI